MGLGDAARGHGDGGGHEEQQAHPFVEPQPGKGVGVVDPQALDEEAPEGVTGDVDREQASRSEPMAALDEQYHADDGQVPQRLVQEGRVIGGDVFEPGGPVGGIDVDGPGKGGWLAVELLG